MFELRHVNEPLVRQQLVHTCKRAKPLCDLIGRWMESGRGSLAAWVPSEAIRGLPESLDRGGITEGGSQVDAQLELMSRASEFFASVPMGVILRESQVAGPSDPWLGRHAGEWHDVQGTVWFVARRPTQGEVEMLELYAGSSHWLNAWLFCRDDRVIAVLKSSERVAEAAAPLIESVWFGAYDAEGFIVWSPHAEP